MREWSESEMNFSSGAFFSNSDSYCSSEQLQYYDMLAEPFGYPFQDPDLQLLPYSQHIPSNLPFSLYSSSPSSTPSPSFSSSQLCHPSYQYSPLETPCEASPEPLSGGPVLLPVGRRSRMGEKIRSQEELCVVCGDKASGYHYNALTCEGCKGFFRRSVTKKAVYHCKNGGGCEMDMYMRRKCQHCRLRKCRAVGMLAECLLTEVQCQSKRLRKGGKERGQDEEPSDSRRVSSTSRLPAQVFSGGLTREQKLLVDRMVEAHRLYRKQDACSWVFEWVRTEEGENLSVLSPNLNKLQQFTRTVPGFDLLDFSDQSSLLSVSSLEVMFLLSAQQFSHNPSDPSPVVQLLSTSANSWSRTTESKEFLQSRTSTSSGHGDDLLGSVLNFHQSMAVLQVSESEYALLTATAILCSDRVSLQATSCVEKMQELILDLLSRLCGIRGGAQRFGRLLGRLTELRTLHHNYLLLTRQQDGMN